MNIIFLDIDGVMNHDGHLVRSSKHTDLEWSPDSVSYLKEILDKTNSKIVVTSTHAIGETVESINIEFFDHYDLSEYVVGITPHLGKWSGERGLEIQKYIDDSIGTNLEVEKFIIIDDDPDMNHLMNKLIFCRQENGHRGLLEKQRDEALELMLQ
jgi:hypothetical protein